MNTDNDVQYFYYRPKNNEYARWKRFAFTTHDFWITDESGTYFINGDDRIAFATHEIIMADTHQLVVYFNTNYADEFDINEIGVYPFDEWYEVLEILDNNPDYYQEIYFGTNEAIEADQYVFHWTRTKAIANFEYEILKKYDCESTNILDRILEGLYNVADE